MQTTVEGECKNRRVFVGGVPLKMNEGMCSCLTEDLLREYFLKFGPVTFFKLGRNKKTQEPLGFAFVEFKSESDFLKVLSQKHLVEGREVVYWSDCQIDVKPFAEENDIHKHNKHVLERKVHVKGLPHSYTQGQLVEAFSQFGPVERGFIMYNHKTGCSRGFGFVEFQNPSDAAKAVKQSLLIGEAKIEVSMAVERAKGVNLQSDSRKSPKKARAKSRNRTSR